MNIYKKTIVLEALGSPGQPWGYLGNVLCHGVENGVGGLSFLSGLLVAFGTLGQPLGLLWGPLGYLSVTFWLHFHKKSIENALQEGIRKNNEK